MRCVRIKWDVKENTKYKYMCETRIQTRNICWDMCVKSYWDVCENTNIQCLRCEGKTTLNNKINIAI